MRRSRDNALRLVAVLLIVGVGAYFLVDRLQSQRNGPPSGQSRLHVIKYVVDGSCAGANLSYNNQSGGIVQLTVRCPWTLEMSERSGFIAYISAQQWSEVTSCHAAVYIDGQLAQEATEKGQYRVVTASIAVP